MHLFVLYVCVCQGSDGNHEKLGSTDLFHGTEAVLHESKLIVNGLSVLIMEALICVAWPHVLLLVFGWTLSMRMPWVLGGASGYLHEGFLPGLS